MKINVVLNSFYLPRIDLGGQLGCNLALCVTLLLPISSYAQAAGCDQGVVRLPDSTGTVTICTALSAQAPQLARQLAAALQGIGAQAAQLRELTRLVKGLNAAGAGLSAERQGRMLASLSSELARAERDGGDRPRRTVEELGDQLDALRDQLIGNLGQERSAAATRQAMQGPVGEAISQLELRSATRQLDEINQRLASLQTDVGEVKAGVASANESLRRIEKAVDPALAADRCADLSCAIYEGASLGAIERLIDKGARLPEDEIYQNPLLLSAVFSARPDRLKVLDFLFRLGFDSHRLFFPFLTERRRLSPVGRQLTDAAYQASRLGESIAGSALSISDDLGLNHWNEIMGCLKSSSRGVSLIELAALMGDVELYRYLSGQGLTLPASELRCVVVLPRRRTPGGRLSDPETAGVRLRIDPDSIKVLIEPL